MKNLQQLTLATFGLLILSLSSVACDGDVPPNGKDGGASTVTDSGINDTDHEGLKYYNGPESAALGATGNQATCMTCHANDDIGMYMSGTTMKDIAYRESYKGGGKTTLLEATNACVTGWMGGTALVAEDASWIALKSYLESISDESVTAMPTLMPEVLADLAAYEAEYAGGDAALGENLYMQACGKCHTERLKVGPKKALATSSLAGKDIGIIAQKVRTAGPPPSSMADAMAMTDMTPGPMPFFEVDELSKDDLKNIIAYLKSL